jgi:2-C-methyl-D-erythritol 2,4-cyclodiphosphate synthase
MTRVGFGYDVHRFGSDRPLMLGGLIFSGESGLEGHSDADVVLHAICDALLGGAGIGDIGQHFPADDETWRNANSAHLLGHVHQLISDVYEIANVDITIVAEHPKIDPRRDEMSRRVAEIIRVPTTRVNIKATTNEGLGDVGRGAGIACYAVVLLEQV